MIAGIGTIGRLFENVSNMDGGVFLGCMASVGPASLPSEPRSVMTCWNDPKKFNKITFAPRGKYNK